MLLPNGVSEDFPGYFMSKNTQINKSRSRKLFGKKWFKDANDTKELINSTESIEDLIGKHKKERELPMFNTITVNRSMGKRQNDDFMKTTAQDNTFMRASFDSMNLHSTRDSTQRFNPLRHSNQCSGSVDLLHSERSNNLPQILIPSHAEWVLKKTNQRLLKNVDMSRLKKLMRKNNESLEMIKNKKMNTNSIKQYQDYNVLENTRPVKKNYMTIPQKPSAIYDWINNVEKVVQAPNIELENYSNYRDNYYKALNSKDKAFNRHLGYFSYFNEKTRREREMNTMYSRKNLSKFANKLRDNSKDRREKQNELQEQFFTPAKVNSRYENRKKSDSNLKIRLSLGKSKLSQDTLINRRASNQQ